MTRARWYEAGGQNTPASPHVRWYEAGGTGTAPASSRVRWYEAGGNGTAAVKVTPLPDLSNVEPGTTVTVTAALAGGGSADSWNWRVVSGPATGLFATGATITFTAPSDINGTSLVIGVTATIGPTTSTEDTFTVTALPQTEWYWTGTGWLPRVDVWAA